MSKITERADRLYALGLRFNGSEYCRDDFNVHTTEITCDTDEEFDRKCEAIEAEMERRARCDQCEQLRINGVVCHETGCPNAWRDEARECKWCGTEFKPESRHQDCCSDDCAEASHG